MPKANSDYEKLARHARADVPFYAQRVKRVAEEINKLLKGHPESAKIMQLVDHYAVDKVNHSNAVDAAERYDRLAAAKREATATPAPTEPAPAAAS